MNTLKTLLVAVGITLSGMANAATSPAETAGICAANAAVIKQMARATDLPRVEAVATEQSARIFNQYGKQPGFETAFRWEFKQNRNFIDRIKTGDGCDKSGF